VRTVVKTCHFHLVSDATGETIRSITRACLAQFEEVSPVEHVWPLIRNKRQLQAVIKGIHEEPGMVLYTLVNDDIRLLLETACRDRGVPCHSVLDPVIAALGDYLKQSSRRQPGRQHMLDKKYFDRIEAMDFTMAHDDGHSRGDLMTADVVLVGVSRTSKTPTSIYLANAGVKTANIPLIAGQGIPPDLEGLSGPLIVGLTTDPIRLVQIRRNRLRMLHQEDETDYIDLEVVKKEVATAQRYFLIQGWPIIDVTRRSIEETAAAIMALLDRRHEALGHAAIPQAGEDEYR
jgi:regulator of PEP synthase PpsR (kinase-PPPase family)